MMQALNKGGGGRGVSLLNIVSELKKCCNHPFLFDMFRARYPDDLAGQDLLKVLVNSCGKMQLLDSMLLRLKERGHRVLLFSQMTRLLDILEGMDFIVFVLTSQTTWNAVDGVTRGLMATSPAPTDRHASTASTAPVPRSSAFY